MAENPLLEALPPKSDYVTYLIILEYNLTVDQLPTLHEILQDTTLTANIGWDLVHLLLPLLPASRQCLEDVARLGNPREVVLKVTELLELLGIEAAREHDASDEEIEDSQESGSHDAQQGDTSDALQLGSDNKNGFPPSKESQFITLLEMLSVLHPRIKTKRPSRFLATALQAVLPAHMFLPSDSAVMGALLALVRALSSASRPFLPSRKSTATVPLSNDSLIAPDPEEDEDAVLAANEAALQSRLLLAFLMRVFGHYMSSLTSTNDIPGLAWCSRLQEKLRPQKIIPGRKTCSVMFAEEESLQERDALVGQIVALARDLKVDPREVLSVVVKPKAELPEGDEGPWSEADQVPLPPLGSLFILTAMMAASTLLDVPTSLPALRIFPDYAAIICNFIGERSMSSIGSESEAVVDAVLFLGFFALSQRADLDPPEDSETFVAVLQHLSILSAECPSPRLRYHAHVLAASILHAHPVDSVRLTFIHDTLEHCPYENLKGSAIGWLKTELLAAPQTSVFLSPRTLATLAPHLFPNPHPLVDQVQFRARLAFFLATLNLYYLLLSSAELYRQLDLQTLTPRHDLRGTFLAPLRAMGREIGRGMAEQSEAETATPNEAKAAEQSGAETDRETATQSETEMELLERTIQMVEDALVQKGL